jgi:hypothetical protein
VTTGLIRTDHGVGELDFVILLLTASTRRLADVERGLADDLMLRAETRDDRTSPVDPGGEVNVLEGHLSRRPATVALKGAGVSLAPREAVDFDRVLVLGILGFPFDALDLKQVVGCHG